MYPVRHTVTVTTAASGGLGTGYTPLIYGRLFSIQYVKDDYAADCDFTITTETTEQNLWVEADVNADKVVAPRQPTHDATGTASLFVAAGEPVEDYFAISGEQIKIAIAEGGVSKSGTFHFVVG